MAIDLTDRVERAITIARNRGHASASPGILAILGARGRELGEVARDASDVEVVLASEVDALGRGRVDGSSHARARIAVLADEGELVASSTAPNASGIDTVVYRRGVIVVEHGAFVLLEVEDGVSGREAAAELGAPLFADERLGPFVSRS